MVSTRRSRSTAGDGNSTEQDAVADATHGSQAEVSSIKKHSRAAAFAVAGHHASPSLRPIVEEPARAAGAAGAQNNEALQPGQQERQQQQQQQPAGQRQQAQRRQSQAAASPAPAPKARAAGAAAAAEAGAGAGAFDSDGDEDWDFDGPDMLQNLAASIRSALGSRGGQQQQQPLRTSSKAPAAAAADGDADADDMDLEQLRWRPQTGLQLPPRVAQLIATTTAAADPRQQQELAAGPVVHNPAAAAHHETGSIAPAAATGPAAATKSKGLAKHTHAPTLDTVAAAKEARKSAPDTAGKKWFNLPAVKITDDVKRDLRLLRLRGAYDPKRFYKSFDDTKFPKHFAIGTVVDDPLDHYGGRLTSGQRKATLTEQLLADSQLDHTRKKRYNKLQEEAQKWVKHKKRRTDMPRKTPSKHRPKH